MMVGSLISGNPWISWRNIEGISAKINLFLILTEFPRITIQKKTGTKDILTVYLNGMLITSSLRIQGPPCCFLLVRTYLPYGYYAYFFLGDGRNRKLVLKKAKQMFLLFWTGALRALRRLTSFSNGRALVISGDKGNNNPDQFKGLMDPHIAVHGSFSVMVKTIVSDVAHILRYMLITGFLHKSPQKCRSSLMFVQRECLYTAYAQGVLKD